MTKRDANAWLAQQASDVSRGQWSLTQATMPVSFRDYSEEWLKHRKVRGRRLPSHTPVYKARAYALVRAILMSAVDEGHLITNPARIRGAGYAPRRHQVRIATVEEVEAIAAAMPSRYRLMPQLATYLALRFGEVSELRRGDIDTKRGVVKSAEPWSTSMASSS